MSKKKNIAFILDSFELYGFNTKYKHINYTYCYSYFDTEEAIRNHINNINTYDIGHLSFDYSDEYDIFIGYNGKLVHFYPGKSTANGKELRFAHNLRRLLIGGALDNDLGIKRNKFIYDNSKSTSELCQEEYNFQQANFKTSFDIAAKTIGLELKPVKPMKDGEAKPEKYMQFIPGEFKDSYNVFKTPHYYKDLKPYNPTEKDYKLFKEFLPFFDKNHGYKYKINAYGDIIIRTNDATWSALAGREWLINKTDMTCKLICMS